MAGGWQAKAGSRERSIAIGAVVAVHVLLLILLMNSGTRINVQASEPPMDIINIAPPREAPAPKPAAPKAKLETKPAPAAPKARSLPTPLPVPPAAPAEASQAPDTGVATGNGNSTGAGSGSGGEGNGTGTGGGGMARHAEWIGDDLADRDYPEAAKRAGLQGMVEVRYIVRVDGWVRDCKVDRSSGSPALDRMTCALVVQRRLYNPARNILGNPVEELQGRRFRFTLARHRR